MKGIEKTKEQLIDELAKLLQISFSIGLSHYNPTDPLFINELIRIADENMYEEKKRKKEGI